MRLEQIGIQYGEQKILKSINLEINKGEIYVLMGPSGSGKTTLLKGIAGLISFSEGAISWDEGNGKTGLVFQEPRLFPHMTVLENLAFGLRAKGVPAKGRKAQVREFLSLLQLEGLEDRYPHQLSGGQKQRVSLGRVLVLRPELLLLDEPFAALDAPLRAQLTEWLYELQRKEKFSILWITHYIDEAFSVADRVGLLINGEIIQEGKPLDFYQNPSSERVSAFFSLANRFPLEQWQRWFPEDYECSSVNEMGWIPASAIKLSFNGSTSDYANYSDEQLVSWVKGMVKRVKHEPRALTISIELTGSYLEVGLDVWEQAPPVGTIVMAGIPLEKIIWYPK